jgi:excisionase family DNA binding protein
MAAHPSSQFATETLAPGAVPATELDAVRRLLTPAPSGAPRRSGFSILGPSGEVVPLPSVFVDLIDRASVALARGSEVSVLAADHELTTQQAADLLNVSRQYLVRLLDAGRLPSRRTGTHRRVRAEDVVAYKLGRDQQRALALASLTRLSEDMGGYPELE